MCLHAPVIHAPAFAVHTPCQLSRRPRPHLSPLFPSSPRMSSAPPLTAAALDATLAASLASKNVVITGATGLIGRALVAHLRPTRANLSLLARNPSAARALFPTPRGEASPTILRYDAASPSLPPAVADAVARADVLINLAGEPVDDGRWTSERKDILSASRVRGTRKLVRAMRERGSRAALVSASAVGYYGASETAAFTEESPRGDDFLARLAGEWEREALRNEPQSRTVVLRIGVVLGNGGGALQKMSMAFRAFLGGPPGGGSQWFSWVHIDDVVRLILHASVEDKWRGVYNATAPQPVRLGRFCEELGKAMGRPNWLPVPKQAVRALLGSEAAELILKGQQVLPKRTTENGFIYKYEDVSSALAQLTAAQKKSSVRI